MESFGSCAVGSFSVQKKSIKLVQSVLLHTFYCILYLHPPLFISIIKDTMPSNLHTEALGSDSLSNNQWNLVKHIPLSFLSKQTVYPLKFLNTNGCLGIHSKGNLCLGSFFNNLEIKSLASSGKPCGHRISTL